MIEVEGDITQLAVDAIVNAANTRLLGDGGVNDAIHRAAGRMLELTCRMLNGCKVGDAKLAEGFKLAARFIVHAVGPVWNGGTHGESELLASCYRRSLEVARDAGASPIAFPAISSGVYRNPAEQVARITVETVRSHGEGFAGMMLCCFSAQSAERRWAALA